MGFDRRNDKRDEVHQTVPVFGVATSEGSLSDTEEPSGESTENRSPIPSPSPLSEPGAELPSLIEAGVVLLNKYRVVEEIGHGGMGSVWLVEHLGFGDKRALKVIHAVVAADPRVRARFRQEAKILAKLKHPNAVIVHDTGIEGQIAFIEMEYLEGRTLRELLSPGKPISIATIMWLLKEVCEVLARAHALGIVHRDLKPENIMIINDPLGARPELKVLDFGIAKIVQQEGDASPGLTLNTEGLLGTPAYSSPEQNDIDPDSKQRIAIDGRSDIYSLGVILFEMLTGYRPFKGTHTQLLCQHAQNKPPRFEDVAPELDIPLAVENVVRRCLEKDPNHRPHSARELYDEFSLAIEEMITREESVPFDDATTEATSTRLIESRVPPLVRPGRLARPRAFWSTRRRLAALGLLVLAPVAWVWFAWKPDSVPPRARDVTERTIPHEFVELLAGAKFQPAQETEIEEDGWPTHIIRSKGEPRTFSRHGRLYLPQGYEPVPEGTEEGLPRVVKSRQGTRFMLIPGGSFMMGAIDESLVYEKEERPRHSVTLSTFYMQENETTIEELDRFREATNRGRDEPELQKYYQVRNVHLNAMLEENCRKHPASGVSHKLAVSYAHWVEGELPSEAQWEYAARSGGKLYLYPWGNDTPRPRESNLENNLTSTINTLEVGVSPRDHSDQGVHDMVGNVREWCRDVWKPYSGEAGDSFNPVQTPSDGETEPQYVIRGGSYDTLRELARVTFRRDLDNKEYKAPENESFVDVGFRVVLEIFVIEPPTVSASAKPGKSQESSR
jgi:serine/threonine protein kinase/formylglycine-generating enzyme required for sulfatase activity